MEEKEERPEEQEEGGVAGRRVWEARVGEGVRHWTLGRVCGTRKGKRVGKTVRSRFGRTARAVLGEAARRGSRAARTP